MDLDKLKLGSKARELYVRAWKAGLACAVAMFVWLALVYGIGGWHYDPAGWMMSLFQALFLGTIATWAYRRGLISGAKEEEERQDG